MLNRLPIVLCAVILLVSMAAVPGGAQEPGAKPKLDALVFGALKSADGLMVRAEKLSASGAKFPKGTAKWFSMMNHVKRTYRISFNGLKKFEKVDLSPGVRASYERISKEVTRRLVGTYLLLIEEYTAVGSRSTAMRLVGELKRVDPKAAAKLGPKALARIFARRKEIGDVSGGRATNPRNRAGRRLTGEEARWLGRRGYPVGRAPSRPAPTPRAPAPAPRNPAPRNPTPRGGPGR